MRAGDTIQTRGGVGENIVCVAGYLFLFFLLWHSSGGWMAMASNGRREKKADLFWSTERNSSARIAISLHGPLNGRAEKERVRLCRQTVSPTSCCLFVMMPYCFVLMIHNLFGPLKSNTNRIKSFGQSRELCTTSYSCSKKKMEIWFVVCLLCVSNPYSIWDSDTVIEPPTHSTFDRSRPVGGRVRESEKQSMME